ncbi:hypothetical protein AB1N83_005479 [Pleurotus pulmonarius]
MGIWSIEYKDNLIHCLSTLDAPVLNHLPIVTTRIQSIWLTCKSSTPKSYIWRSKGYCLSQSPHYVMIFAQIVNDGGSQKAQAIHHCLCRLPHDSRSRSPCTESRTAASSNTFLSTL